jgi:hypothetical protein
VSPFVQGEIDHDGSGLSLTGGGKTVELTDVVVDPGASVLTGNVAVDGRGRDRERAVLLAGRPHAAAAETEGSTDALSGGLAIGVARITVTPRSGARPTPETRKARSAGLFHGRSRIRTWDLFLIREAL